MIKAVVSATQGWLQRTARLNAAEGIESNILSDYVLGVYCCKIASFQELGRLYLVKCLKQLSGASVRAQFQQLPSVKIRIYENLIYAVGKEDNIELLLELFEREIEEMPTKGIGIAPHYLKYAKFLFYKEGGDKTLYYLEQLSALYQEQIESQPSAKLEYIDNYALLQSYIVQILYYKGHYEQSLKKLLTLIRQDAQINDFKLKICLFFVFDYCYYGLYQNAELILKLLLGEFKHSAYTKDLHILLALVYLEQNSVYEQQLDDSLTSASTREQKTRTDRLKKSPELVALACQSIQCVIEYYRLNDKPEQQNRLNEIEALLFDIQGNPLLAYEFYSKILPFKLPSAETQVELRKEFDRLSVSCHIALKLMELAQYDECSKIWEALLMQCDSICAQLPPTRTLANLADFRLFCKVKIFEINVERGDLALVREQLEDIAALYAQLTQKAAAATEHAPPTLTRLVAILETALAAYYFFKHQYFQTGSYLTLALDHLEKLEQTAKAALNAPRSALPGLGKASGQAPAVQFSVRDYLSNAQIQVAHVQNIVQHIWGEKTEEDDSSVDLIQPLISLKSWKIQLYTQMCLNNLRVRKNLVDQHLNLKRLETYVLSYRTRESIQYAHFQKAKILTALAIKQNKLIDMIAINQQMMSSKQYYSWESSYHQKQQQQHQSGKKEQFIRDFGEWALATKQLYTRLYKDQCYDFTQHPDLALCDLAICDYCLQQKQIIQATKAVQEAGAIFNSVYLHKTHPHFIYLHLMKVYLQTEKRKIICDNVSQTIKIPQKILSNDNKQLIVKETLQELPDLLTIFDQYQKIGIRKFLEDGLKKYIDLKAGQANEASLSQLQPSEEVPRHPPGTTQAAAARKNKHVNQLINQAYEKFVFSNLDSNLAKKEQEESIEKIIRLLKEDIHEESKRLIGSLFTYADRQNNSEIVQLKLALEQCNLLFEQNNELINTIIRQIQELSPQNQSAPPALLK